MVDIHSAHLTFAHSLANGVSYRLLPACNPAPAHSHLHDVPRGPLLKRGLTPFLALTTSCASPKASSQLSLFTRWAVLAAWTIRCWSLGPSRRYLTRIFSWMLGPIPRLSQRCLYPFLPTALRPSRNGYAVGSLAKNPYNDFCTDRTFGAAVISLCSGLQVCLPPGSFLPLALSRSGQL
jgi:hypothetical protein